MKTLLTVFTLCLVISTFANTQSQYLESNEEITVTITQPGYQNHDYDLYLTMHIVDLFGDHMYSLISRTFGIYKPFTEGDFITSFELERERSNLKITYFFDSRALEEKGIKKSLERPRLCFVLKYDEGFLNPFDTVIKNSCIDFFSLKENKTKRLKLKTRQGNVEIKIDYNNN